MATTIAKPPGVDSGRTPAPRTLRRRRKPAPTDRSLLVGVAAWAVGLLFAAPVLWMVQDRGYGGLGYDAVLCAYTKGPEPRT